MQTGEAAATRQARWPRAEARGPRSPSFAVVRHRLIRRLELATALPVTQIVAPAGYGKSVLLAQWGARATVPVTWLNVDARDNSAIHLAHSIVAGLQAFEPDIGNDSIELLQRADDGLGDAFIASLVEEFALLPNIVLVFDSLESIRNGAVLEDIATIIDHAPPNVHFVLSSRSDVGIGLHGLRVRGDLGELRQRDLAMDEDEARVLVGRVARLHLSDDAIGVLVARTEGWPAGLQLAALSLRGRDDPEEVIRTFSGDDAHVADYLTDEVVLRQPADVREFLMDTSVLFQLSGPLCDAVTGRSDSQRVLEGLDQSGLLIARLDDTRTWYRYHPLLRDLLRYELMATDKPRVHELLVRAARWHESRDELDLAGQYVIATEDWDEVAHLIRRHGRSLYAREEISLLVDWLAALPEDVRRSHLDLQLCWVVALLDEGRVLAAEEELARLRENKSLTAWQEAAFETTRAAMAPYHERPEQVIKSGRRALECLELVGPDDEPFDVFGVTSVASLRVVSKVSMGRAWDFLGANAKARALLSECVDAGDWTYRRWMINATGALAYLDARDGEPERATALAARMLDIVKDTEFAEHPAGAEAHLALGRVARDRNRLEEASLALDEAQRRVRGTGRFALLGSLVVEAALLALAQDRFDDGHAIISGARTDGRPAPPPAIAARLVAVEARLHLAGGDITRAQRVLNDFDGLHNSDVSVAEIAVAVAARDVPSARKALDAFDGDACRRTRIQHALWSAIVDEIDGDHRSARDLMALAVAHAEPLGIVREFLDARTDSLRVLRALYHNAPTPFLRELVEHEVVLPPVQSSVSGIFEQLSDREMMVLQYLPSRLSNTEIAQNMYVSVNTLKTHLKHIYRKLGVENRSAAIAKAESLRLL